MPFVANVHISGTMQPRGYLMWYGDAVTNVAAKHESLLGAGPKVPIL